MQRPKRKIEKVYEGFWTFEFGNLFRTARTRREVIEEMRKEIRNVRNIRRENY
jgi:hypothetical protein